MGIEDGPVIVGGGPSGLAAALSDLAASFTTVPICQPTDSTRPSVSSIVRRRLPDAPASAAASSAPAKTSPSRVTFVPTGEGTNQAAITAPA